MNKKQLITGLAVTMTMLASCTSNGYRIEGSGEALKEGDTLFITTDLTELTPSDTIVVKDRRFTISGETDTTYFCLLYSSSDNNLAVPFFVEPGTIKIELPKDQALQRVSGTLCNQEWQIVSDTLTELSKKVNQIAMQLYSGELNIEEQSKKQAQFEQLNDNFKNFIYRMAKKNISNEFGYFVINYFEGEVLSADQRKELIQLMPQELRSRPLIRQMETELSQLQSTAAGSQINDILMADMNGKEQSILAEVKHHKLTILDFWASWCGPCRQAMPDVVRLYAQYKDKGLGIIGISLDNDKQAWTDAVKELGMTWPQVSDLKGWDNAAAQAFNIRAIPHMMVLDQEGRIVKSDIHGAEIENLLKEKLGQ